MNYSSGRVFAHYVALPSTWRCCYVVNNATRADDICQLRKDSFQFFATSLSLIPGDVSNVFRLTGSPIMCAHSAVPVGIELPTEWLSTKKQ